MKQLLSGEPPKTWKFHEVTFVLWRLGRVSSAGIFSPTPHYVTISLGTFPSSTVYKRTFMTERMIRERGECCSTLCPSQMRNTSFLLLQSWRLPGYDSIITILWVLPARQGQAVGSFWNSQPKTKSGKSLCLEVKLVKKTADNRTYLTL